MTGGERRYLPVCARCGQLYSACPHISTLREDITPQHAARIRTAYVLGRRFNPDHDETSYYAQTGEGAGNGS